MFNSKNSTKINETVKAEAIENVRREYGYVSAQSVAIEYERLMNVKYSELRKDATGSKMGTAGRK